MLKEVKQHAPDPPPVKCHESFDWRGIWPVEFTRAGEIESEEMNAPKKFAIVAIVLLVLACVLDLTDQIQAGKGIHFRLLHASTILLLFLMVRPLTKKPN